MRLVLPIVAVLLLAVPASAATPYHLELEATPEAAFPYLGRFGKVDLHIYADGVRGEALWLHGISRNGSKTLIVANPLGRMYVDMALTEITQTLRKLAGDAGSIERAAAPVAGPILKGTVKGIAATRHRLVYGPQAWIDVWMTQVIPQNEQLRVLMNQVVGGISPGTAAAASKLPGTPIYVELNFRRFKKVPLVKLKSLTYSAEGEEDALTLGSFYMRAGMLEKILGTK